MFLNPSCWPLLRHAGEWFAQIKGLLPCGKTAGLGTSPDFFPPLPSLLCFIGILIFSKGWIRLFCLCRTTKKLPFVPADINLGCEMSFWPPLPVHTLLAETLSLNRPKPTSHAENPPEWVRWCRRCVWIPWSWKSHKPLAAGFTEGNLSQDLLISELHESLCQVPPEIAISHLPGYGFIIQLEFA